MKSSQTGAVQVISLVLTLQVLSLVLVFAGALFVLILMKNPQIFQAQAEREPIVFKSPNGDFLPIGSQGLPATLSPKIKIQLKAPPTTLSFQLAEDPLALERAAQRPYTQEPTVLDYEFVNKTAGIKSIFVKFILSDKTATVRIRQVELATQSP